MIQDLPCSRIVIVTLFVAPFLLCHEMLVKADQVYFKQGGAFRGQYEKKGDNAIIESPLGITISVDHQDVEKAVQTSNTQDDYLRKVRITPQTVDAQWELSDWCRKNGMTANRKKHLEQILVLKPEHEKAHLALGHVKEKGEWVDREKKMLDLGYVKHKGKFITQEEYDLIKEEEISNVQEREWYPKIRLWVTWISSSNQTKIQEGQDLLTKINDPLAIKPLSRFLGTHKNVNYRIGYVDILSKINGQVATEYLAKQAVIDDDTSVRNHALAKILEGRQQEALPVIIRFLKNESNQIVRKAGLALGKVGGPEVVPVLIEALSTAHTYQVQVPVPGTGFVSGGNSSGTATGLPKEIEMGLLTGQYPNGVIVNRVGQNQPTKTVSVRIEQQNPEVLQALVAITGQDFGYHELTWKNWWFAKNSK